VSIVVHLLTYQVLEGKPEGRRSFERPRYRWGIILKWILKKQDGRVWTGLVWLRIGISGGLLRTWQWKCGIYLTLGIFIS
jgi:hypothetical protein